MKKQSKLFKPRILFTVATLAIIMMGINYFLLKQNPLIPNSTKRKAPTSPNSVWTHLANAQYFEKTGSIEQAREQYQKACTMGYTFACTQAASLPTASPTPSP